jgi:hypothetical protein
MLKMGRGKKYSQNLLTFAKKKIANHSFTQQQK